jgi:hypothetical protein
MRKFLLLVGVVLLAGCAYGPDYYNGYGYYNGHGYGYGTNYYPYYNYGYNYPYYNYGYYGSNTYDHYYNNEYYYNNATTTTSNNAIYAHSDNYWNANKSTSNVTNLSPAGQAATQGNKK